MATLPSASRLERASKCVGSAVLPRVDDVTTAMERGSAIHAFLARVAEVGREEALAEVPEAYRAACEVVDLDVLPTAALEVIAELALAYDVEAGTARELGRNLRKYPRVAASECIGVADIVTLTPDEVFVADYKAGRGLLTSAQENTQLRLLGLAVARRFRRPRVRVALIRLLEDGTALFDSVDFDAFELDVVAEDLRDLAGRIAAARDRMARGEPPPVTTGAHCRRCPSLVYCPAQTALIRKMVESPDHVARDILAELTPEHASTAWERLKVVEEVVRRARESLYAFARDHPIPLPSGMVLGEVEVRRRVLDGSKAYEVLERLHGPAVAHSGVELEATQAGIERALQGVAGATGEKLVILKRHAMKALEEAGAVTVRTNRSVREHRPDQPGAAPSQGVGVAQR